MILTGAKFEEIGRALYGDVWVSVMAKKLKRSKRTIMRMRDEASAIPPEMRIGFMDLINDQYAVLAEQYDWLAAALDDAS